MTLNTHPGVTLLVLAKEDDIKTVYDNYHMSYNVAQNIISQCKTHTTYRSQVLCCGGQSGESAVGVKSFGQSCVAWAGAQRAREVRGQAHERQLDEGDALM